MKRFLWISGWVVLGLLLNSMAPVAKHQLGFAFWIKLEPHPQSQGVLTGGKSGHKEPGWWIYRKQDTLFFEASDSHFRTMHHQLILPFGEWHLLAGDIDLRTKRTRFFLDGKLMSENFLPSQQNFAMHDQLQPFSHPFERDFSGGIRGIVLKAACWKEKRLLKMAQNMP